MNESITLTTKHFSPAASLAAIGVKLRQLDLFGPIRTEVQIRQKTVKHTPVDKLSDAFISLLAGAHGLVEINTRLRTDPALQHAFGRQACAEQSVVQERRWMRVRRRMSGRCSMRWIGSTGSTVEGIGTTTKPVSNCWMWI
jgi:hypothetical protein